MSDREHQTHEQETMDRWLRQAMSAEPVPAISSGFDDRLARRLRPRRLNAAGRWLMVGYAVAATAFAIWLMRSQSLDWLSIAAGCAAPVAVVVFVYGRRLRTAS